MSFIVVRVWRVMLFVSVGFWLIWFWIFSNMIMLCLRLGLMISVVVFGFV